MIETNEILAVAHNEQSDVAVSLERSQRLCEFVLARVFESPERAASQSGKQPTKLEINLRFVSKAVMADLNERHMAEPAPTDVLAFPLISPPLAAPLPPGSAGHQPVSDHGQPGDHVLGDHVLLGDIVVCPAVAQANAGRSPTGTAEPAADPVTLELDTLIVHGILHLLGMDHVDSSEAEVMFAAQAEHLTEFWALCGHCLSSPSASTSAAFPTAFSGER